MLGLIPSAAATASEGCDLRLEILDLQEQPVKDAVFTLLEMDRSASTDAEGQLCWSEILPGRYTALVVADGYSVLDFGFDKVEAEPLHFELALQPAFGEEMVVTATRTERRLAEVPVHVEQVSREVIEASSARTLAEAIELSPGVRIESNCQNCNVSAIRLLGLEGPYSQLLVDGQPTVSSLALVYGIEQFPAQLLDSVEIVKGGGAAIYGAGAVGGVINLIPHAPDDTHATFETRSSEVGGEAGLSLSAIADWSPGDRSSGVTVLGQWDELDASDRDGDGYSEVTQRELQTFAVRGELGMLQGSGRLVVEANHTSAYRRGGELAGIDLPADQTSLTEEIDTERLGLGISWLHVPRAEVDYRLSFSYADTDRSSYYGADFDPGAFGETENPLWVADSQFNWYREKGTLTFGAQASRDELRDVQLGYGREVFEVNENQAIFIQEDRSLGDSASILYGVRADQHSVLDDPVLSPRLAVMHSPRSDLTFRFSVAQGFRAPVTFDEDLHIELAGGDARVIVPTDGLTEERSLGLLLSGEWRPRFGTKGSASVEVAWFRTELDDLFQVVEADDPLTPGLTEFRRINAEGAVVQGVEIASSLRWGSALSAQWGVVFQSSRLDVPEPDFSSRDFFRTPDVSGTFSLLWRLPQEWSLFAGARYTGSMVMPHYAGFIAEDRLERTGSFFEVDLSVSKELQVAGRELTVTVGSRNLTDEYQPDLDQGAARDSNYVYGPRYPRSVFLGLRLNL